DHLHQLLAVRVLLGQQPVVVGEGIEPVMAQPPRQARAHERALVLRQRDTGMRVDQLAQAAEFTVRDAECREPRQRRRRCEHVRVRPDRGAGQNSVQSSPALPAARRGRSICTFLLSSERAGATFGGSGAAGGCLRGAAGAGATGAAARADGAGAGALGARMPPRSLKRATSCCRCSAWDESAWLVPVSSSAWRAVAWVALSMCTMARFTCSMPEACSWLETLISDTRSATFFAFCTMLSSFALAMPTRCVPSPTFSTLSLMSPLISLAAWALRWARLRTSAATTANPRPCSPARAASTAALSASRLV